MAQIVALTCHGNASLRGVDASEFFPKNSTCNFCDQVTFVSVKKSFFGRLKEKEIAKTPQEWFAHLKSTGAIGILLSRQPQKYPRISDRMSAGFVNGGGIWYMEVVYPKNRSNFWIARWNVWNREAAEQRIWRVVYGCVSKGANFQLGPHDFQSAVSRLVQTLHEIHAFSAKHNGGGFTQCFAEALDTLNSGGTNLHGYHKNLAPAGCLSQQARTLLDACQKAWVFGGMGSWNDMGFDGMDRTEYERVSENLFRDLNEAIAAGANQSFYENGKQS